VLGKVPTVVHVPLIEEEGAPTPLELEDALPLGSLLAPVAASKDAIAAALETLAPEAKPEQPDTGVPA
jgi:hypothetical protein